MDIRKKSMTVVQFLTPEIVCTIVGIILGIAKHSNTSLITLPESVAKEIIRLNIGAVAHHLAWIVSIYVFKWKMNATFRGIWKQSALGTVLTYIMVLAVWFNDFDSVIGVSFLAIKIVAICVVVQIFLFHFGFYLTVEKALPIYLQLDPAETVSDPECQLMTLNIDGKIERINVQSISLIRVEDHYCTIVYQRENQWREWTLYEKLKHFEESYPDCFLRINRSTLVNPRKVKNVEKVKGKYAITMLGDDENLFSLSPSQTHLLDQLIPVTR